MNKNTLRLTRPMAPHRYAPLGWVRLANQTKALNGYEPVADRRTYVGGR